MKVTGETFSFHHRRKGAEEARYQKYEARTEQFLILMCLFLNIKICGGMIIRFKNIQLKKIKK
jgi:hypothetical protein